LAGSDKPEGQLLPITTAIVTLIIEGAAMPTPPDTRVQELHLTFPPAPKPMAKYRPVVRVGNLLYTSGHGPLMPDGALIKGRVGADLTPEQGYQAARQVGLATLSTLRANLGSLNKVKRIIKTFGLVLCTAEFTDQPKVMNGFSELMAEVFGDEAGVGARSAVGTHALPSGMAVEVECVFEVE
jgi:enamine deaminase RidA (YjgF/YER057c/UK114 family)